MTQQSVDREALQRPRRSNVHGVIACQGDSLTFGSRDPDGMSYPRYLGRMLSEKHGQTWTTVKLGAPGECWVASIVAEEVVTAGNSSLHLSDQELRLTAKPIDTAAPPVHARLHPMSRIATNGREP